MISATSPLSRATDPSVFELIKLLREALPIQSTWAFVGAVALMFGVSGGGVGLLIDKIYRQSIGELFSVQRHSSLVANYPGPLVYRYNSQDGLQLAPVGLAIVLEVVNTRTATKIRDYSLDVEVKNKWWHLPNLGARNPTEFFWVKDGNLATCIRLDFTESAFDTIAANHLLQPGDSVKGWMFFEWPPELRSAAAVKIARLRLNLQNSRGENQSVIVDPHEAAGGHLSASMLVGADFRVHSQGDNDLSSFPIRPHFEYLQSFR